MNDILIIGASGFIGSALLNYFEKHLSIFLQKVETNLFSL